MTGPIKSIVILGGGTAGWMAAAALSKALANSGARIQLIESNEIGTIGVGEASVPALQAFNAFLGLDQRDFMRNCQATFKLGIEFVDWGALGRRYMHSFTGYGPNVRSSQFHRLFQRHSIARQARGATASFDDYNLGAIASRERRFALPADGPTAHAGELTFAYHFDAILYARYLRDFAERRGVHRTEGKVVSSRQHSDTGFIEAVRLTDGRELGGELFIDCSGFGGLLIEGALRSGYEEWGHWLPCDRAVAMQTHNVEPPVPFTRSTAESAGWSWRIPLQHRVGNGYVYCSRHLSDDAAETMLKQRVSGEALSEPRRIRFVTGKRRRIWNRNCVALGLAAGFLEPLESTSIHLIQSSLFRLISLFPDRRFESAEIDAFNRQTEEEYADIRDFIITHYKLTSRTDAEFWMHCRCMDVPDRVGALIELFGASGRLTPKPEQLFTAQSWFAILYGQGDLPRGYDPLLAPMPEADLEHEMARCHQRLKQAVQSMPGHAQFVANYCGAALPRD
ncbi:MAG: tryptophan 7-halogenase [Steroidobacteraceae bacterium]|nr:tryptophan 7-halogenase [Steroidobacteraceae bacterium]